METESLALYEVLLMLVGVILADYFRVHLRAWFGFSQALSGALAVILGGTLAWLLYGHRKKVSNRSFFFWTFLIAVIAYLVSLKLHL